MMLTHHVVDDQFGHAGKNNHHQRADDGASERAQRQRRVTLPVTKTREAAPVCAKTSRSVFRSTPSAAPSASPSARPAVLIFITMLTSAFTLAASPALPTNRTVEASSLSKGSAFRKAVSAPPH